MPSHAHASVRVGVTAAFALCICAAATASVDLTYRRHGLSIGDSARVNGLRLNFTDRNLREVNGINFTLWRDDEEPPNSRVDGLAIGLFPRATRLTGLQLGLASVRGTHVTGIGVAPGVGADKNLTGVFAAVGMGAGNDLTGNLHNNGVRALIVMDMAVEVILDKEGSWGHGRLSPIQLLNAHDALKSPQGNSLIESLQHKVILGKDAIVPAGSTQNGI